MTWHHLMLQFRTMLFAVTLASCVALGSFQPGPCSEDNQCHEGFFCDTSLGECHECLSCQTLKREPPPTPSSCVKSVTECGPCLKGLVVDLHSDLSCSPPATTADGAPTDNTAVWVTVSVVVLLVLIGAAAVVVFCISRSKKSITVNVDTNIDTTLPTHYVATAPALPESPPPYSPPPDKGTGESDQDYPLMQPYQPPLPEYESQDHQNVSMYNNPNYVRLPNSPLPAEGHIDLNGNNSPLIHDEDTAPSPWEPDPHYNDTDGRRALNGATSPNSHPQRPGDSSTTAGDFSTALAIARNTDLIQAQPMSLEMQPLDASEEINGGDDSTSQNAYGASSARPAQNGNYIFMNVTNQLNFVVKPPQSNAIF